MFRTDDAAKRRWRETTFRPSVGKSGENYRSENQRNQRETKNIYCLTIRGSTYESAFGYQTETPYSRRIFYFTPISVNKRSAR